MKLTHLFCTSACILLLLTIDDLAQHDVAVVVHERDTGQDPRKS